MFSRDQTADVAGSKERRRKKERLKKKKSEKKKGRGKIISVLAAGLRYTNRTEMQVRVFALFSSLSKKFLVLRVCVARSSISAFQNGTIRFI